MWLNKVQFSSGRIELVLPNDNAVYENMIKKLL